MLARLGLAMKNVDVVENGEKAVICEAETAYDLVLSTCYSIVFLVPVVFLPFISRCSEHGMFYLTVLLPFCC